MGIKTNRGYNCVEIRAHDCQTPMQQEQSNPNVRSCRMSPRKNSGDCHWIFDFLGFTLIYRMFPQAVRLAWAASLFAGIASGGAASAQTKAATVTSLSVTASGSEASSVAA